MMTTPATTPANPTDLPPTTLLDWALFYARHGWAVFPLKSRDKTPLTTNGYKDATTDEARIRDWWMAHAEANIGVPVPDGYAVVDIDTRHGGTLAQLAPLTTPTVQAKTGGGGFHLWFRVPEGVTLTGNRFETLNGIDLKLGGKGYVVVAPSVHPSGERYAWMAAPFGDRPLAEMPSHIVTLAQAQKQTTVDGTGERRSQWDEDDGAIAEGGRNNELTKRAGRMRRAGLAFDELLAALTTMNTRRCLPPLPAGEVRAIAESVCRYEPGKPREDVHEAQEPVRVVETWEGLDLWDADLPELEWAVPGLLPEGCTLLAGRPKAGKTYLSLGLAIAIASGGVALGVADCTPGRVLYLALEDTPLRMRKRMHELLANRRPARLALTIRTGKTPPRIDTGLLDYLNGFIDTHPDTRLIIVDTLAKVKPPSRSHNAYDYTEDYAAIDKLTTLANARHVAVLVVTHSRKMQGEHAVDDVSGTAGLTGAADTVMVLRKVPNSKNAELHIDARDVEQPCIELTRHPETSGWMAVGEESVDLRMTSKQQAVVDYLRAHGVSAADALWQALRRASDGARERNAFDKHLARMLNGGSLVKPDRGMYDLPPALKEKNPSDRGNSHSKSQMSQKGQMSQISQISQIAPGDGGSDILTFMSTAMSDSSDARTRMDSASAPQSDVSDASDIPDGDFACQMADDDAAGANGWDGIPDPPEPDDDGSYRSVRSSRAKPAKQAKRTNTNESAGQMNDLQREWLGKLGWQGDTAGMTRGEASAILDKLFKDANAQHGKQGNRLSDDNAIPAEDANACVVCGEPVGADGVYCATHRAHLN